MIGSALIAALEKTAQATRGDREDDVVDGRLARGPHRFQLVELGRDVGDAAVAADLAVEKCFRRGRPAGSELGKALRRAAHAAGCRARRSQRLSRGAPRETKRRRHPLRGGANEEHFRARFIGLPGLGRQLHFGPVFVWVEDDRADVDCGNSLDEVDLPQRPGEVERLGHDLADQHAQLVDAAGLG